jgi:hypothetical protein
MVSLAISCCMAWGPHSWPQFWLWHEVSPWAPTEAAGYLQRKWSSAGLGHTVWFWISKFYLHISLRVAKLQSLDKISHRNTHTLLAEPDGTTTLENRLARSSKAGSILFDT